MQEYKGNQTNKLSQYASHHHHNTSDRNIQHFNPINAYTTASTMRHYRYRAIILKTRNRAQIGPGQ